MKANILKYGLGAALLTVPHLALANNGLEALGDAFVFMAKLAVGIPVGLAIILTLIAKKEKKTRTFFVTLLSSFAVLALLLAAFMFQ
jgi:hypothetical protein